MLEYCFKVHFSLKGPLMMRLGVRFVLELLLQQHAQNSDALRHLLVLLSHKRWRIHRRQFVFEANYETVEKLTFKMAPEGFSFFDEESVAHLDNIHVCRRVPQKKRTLQRLRVRLRPCGVFFFF